MDPGPRFVEHINTAHPFECEHCDLRYVEQEKLRKHKRSHQKVKEKRHEMLMGESVKEGRKADGGKMDEEKSSSKNKDASLKNANKLKGPKKMSALALDLPKSKDEVQRKSVDSITVVTNYWKCNHCEMPFPTESEMKTHEEKPHGQSCTACSMRFIYAIDFKRHQVEKHDAASKGITKCDLCNEPTEDKSLSSHKKAKHAFKCDLCSLKFVQKAKLWKHMVEEHQHGTWVNRLVNQSNSKLAKTHDLKSREHHPIPKLVEGERALQAVKRKDEKIFPRKVSKPKEEKWETVKDKKEKADGSREKVVKSTSGGKLFTLGAKESYSREKSFNSGVKPSTLGLKQSTVGVRASASGAKASNSGAKATNSELKASNLEAKTGEKKQSEEVDRESEKLEECSLCKEVCSLNAIFII